MQYLVRVGLVVCLGVAVGCSGAAEDQPEVFPVSGTVTHKGQPVEGAVVSFTTEGAARAATGTTDAEGKFVLSTYGDGDGAVPGPHKVTVVKVDPELQQREGEDANAYTSRIMGKDPGRSLLPAKYASPTHTPLTANVTAEGPNEFTFVVD
jgi:hypothetical protein